MIDKRHEDVFLKSPKEIKGTFNEVFATLAKESRMKNISVKVKNFEEDN